jgi:hypothetical protein
LDAGDSTYTATSAPAEGADRANLEQVPPTKRISTIRKNDFIADFQTLKGQTSAG